MKHAASQRAATVVIWLLIFGRAAGGNVSATAENGTIRFLVAEVGEVVHGDSYVLPLADPADIAHARNLIHFGEAAGRPIVSAWIAPGANGINRNVLADGSPPWSWHVTGLHEFADITAEIFDGWPTFVNDDVPGWIDNTEGQIGFWNYSVVAELPTGDYDADLDVDLDDYSVWRSGLGEAVDLSADGNGNGAVDAADYVLWRRNLGTSVMLPATRKGGLAVVPEPTILSLALVGAACFSIARRQTC